MRVVAVCAVAGLAVLSLALGVSAGVAWAEDLESSADLGGSSLAVVAQPISISFSVTLNGTSRVLEGAGSSRFTVVDARGTGTGWQVAMQASRFTNSTVTGKQLASNSFSAPLFRVSKGDPTSSDVPGEVRSASIDNDAGAVIASCSAVGQGMGTYEFSADPSAWRLAIGADEYAGTYSSVITITVSPLAL